MYEQITIIGNLGDDPKTTSLPSGDDVCNFDIAVNHTTTNRQGERKTFTKWFQVAVFGRDAANCQRYLRRGRQVTVVGRVSASAYIGRDGKPRASMRVKARDVVFLGQGGDGSGQGNGRGQSQGQGGRDRGRSDAQADNAWDAWDAQADAEDNPEVYI